MIAFVKSLSRFLLVLVVGSGSSLADTDAVSADLSRFIVAQNYSESSDASTPKKTEHADHDDPLFIYSYEISATDDDNIRLAQVDDDIREDGSVSVKLKARGGMPLGRKSMLSFGGNLAYEAFDAFDDLNNITLEANIGYRFARSVGYAAPIYNLALKIGGIDSESEMRDSTTASISFDMSKRLTTAIRMTSGLSVNSRESKSEVFDTRDARFFINLDLNLSKSALVYTTYRFISGDIVSSGTPSLDFINAADAIEPDDAYGGRTTNQFAYRLDADTHVISLGYNHNLSRSFTIDLSYQFADSQASGDIEYERNILRASLLGRF